jgi:integrase
MLAQGTDLYVVSEVLGHSSVAITKDVYGHLAEGQKRAAAELTQRPYARRWLPEWLP